MAICSHLAPNQEKSILYDVLQQKYGEDKAHDIWDTIRTDQFKAAHGNWTTEGQLAVPLDANGEPTAEWVESKVPHTEPISQPAQKETILTSLEPEKAVRGKNRDTEETITSKIASVYETARQNPDKVYQIDYDFSNPKQVWKNGYTSRELVDLYNNGAIPDNIQFDSSFHRMVENSTKSIVDYFTKNQPPVEFISRNEELLADAMSKILVPKDDGLTLGYFTPTQHQEVIDSIVAGTRKALIANPALGANAILKVIQAFDAGSKSMEGTEAGNNFKAVYNQRVRFVEGALKRLSDYGLKIPDESKYKILQAVDLVKAMSESDKKAWSEANPEIAKDFDEGTGEFIEAMGRGLKDWNDVVFELDPKDTASSRIKMFIATMPETDRGVYKISQDSGVYLDPSTIKVGDGTLQDLIDAHGESLAFSKWKQADPLAVQRVAEKVNRQSLWMKDDKTSQEFTKFLDSNFNLVPQNNFLGMRKLVNFNNTFDNILEELADKKQNFEDWMKILQQSGKPNLQYLVGELRNADEQMQREFMKVMSKQYQNFDIVVFNTLKDADGNKSYNLNVINSNRYSQKNTIIDNWKQGQKLSEIMIVNKNGERVTDVKRAQEKWLPMLRTAMAINDWSDPKNLDWAKKAMGNVLRISGIDLTPDMLNELFDKMGKYTEGKSFAGGIGRQFSVNRTDGKPNGMFSAFILKSAGLNNINDTETGEKAESAAQQNNPLYTEDAVMKTLAAVAAEFTPVLHSANHKSGEGKSVWDYGLNTKLSLKFNDMVSNFKAFTDIHSKIDVSKDNWLLSAISDNQKLLEKMQLHYMDSMKPGWAKTGTTRPDMSDREQLLTILAFFQGTAAWNKATAHYVSLTHSDKTMTPLFMNMPKLNMGRYDVIPDTIIGKIGSALYNVFAAEHTRITKQENIDFNNAQYDKGKRLFYFIPEFNYDNMQKMVADKVLTQKEFESIWLAGQRKLNPIINSDKQLPIINRILTDHLNNLTNSTMEKWEKEGIVSEDGLMFDRAYARDMGYINGLKFKDGKYTRGKGNTIEEVPKSEAQRIIERTAAKDFAMNYFLFNTSLSQLMYGDPAMSYKASKIHGATDMDHVESTMKEYAKRLAKDIAPGQDPYWNENEKTYNTITLKDVKTSENYLKEFGKIHEAYTGVEATDAQELTTVEEHLKVMNAMGLIPSAMYTEMIDIVKHPDKNGYYEFLKPEHLAMVLQPMKPVYAGPRAPKNGAQLEDYIKSSSYPLYPPMTTGTEIDNLRQYMEDKQIARANFASAKKIGNPAEPLEAFTKDGKWKTPDEKISQAAQQQLDRSNFRIQQEVPYDEDKDHILTVSQMNKLIVEGIGHIENFNVRGFGEMSGETIRALKEDIRKQMISSQYDDLLKKFNVKPDTMNIIDKNTVYDMVAKEADKKGYTLNERQGLLERDPDGTLAIPLVYNTAADRLESIMMSIVNKTTDIKMPGKSFIQAASVGYTRDSIVKENAADTSKVIWMEGYGTSPLKTIHKGDDGEIHGAQVLVPFNFADAGGNKLKVEDFTKTGADEKRYINTERLPQELLQLIGARIPNQGHNSMLPIEIAGFIPSNMGDLVIVPSAITKQMGADFDVDKLYTYRRPYTYDAETKSFSTIKAEDREGNPKMNPKDFNTEQLQNAYFDVHHAILTHPKMIDKVLSPLDKPDLKTLAAELEKENRGKGGNYYDVINQLNDFQRGKDAKALVALTSLSVTFNAVIQDKNLHLIKIVSEDGKMVTKNDEVKILDNNGKEIALTQLSGVGKSEFNGETRTKADNHTTVQSASVDNAKDRTLDNLNITLDTYKALDALSQLQTASGTVVALDFSVGLLTQPIIREYNDMMRKGNDSLSTTYIPNLKESVIKDLIAKYKEKFPEAPEKAKEVLFNTDELNKARTADPETEEFAVKQLAALELFKRLDEIGQRKSELQSIMNQDTNGAGMNILTALDKAEKASGMEQAPIGGTESLWSTQYGPTEQAVSYSKTVPFATNVLTQILPYASLSTAFADVMGAGNRDRLTIDTKRDVIKAFRSLAYTSEHHWFADAQQERVRLLYPTENSKSLAQQLLEAKQSWAKDNYFLQRLDPVISDHKDGADYVQYKAAIIGNTDEEQTQRSWLELLMSKDDTQRKLGEDLLRYTFLTGGIQDATSFVKFVPISYLAHTPFGDMLKAKEETFGTHPGFLEQFMQHNPQHAVRIDSKAFGEYLTKGHEFPEAFKVPSREDPNYQYMKGAFNADGKASDYVAYKSLTEKDKWALYRKVPSETGDYYVRIDTLGNRYTDEYNGNMASAQRSIFTENRALASAIPYSSPVQDLFNAAIVTRDGYYEGVTRYDQIGLREGGKEAIDDAMHQIIDNPLIPEHLRTTAKLLSVSSDAVSASAREVFGLDYTPSVKFDSDSPYRGHASFDGSMEFNPDRPFSRAEAAEVFLHEATHQQLQYIIAAGGYDPRVNVEVKDVKHMEEFAKQHPEVMEHLKQLDRIRYEAFNELSKRLGDDRVKEIQEDLSKNDRHKFTSDHQLVYALSSLQELTAHVMTKSDVAKFLNDTQSSTGGNSLLGRFIAKIADIMRAFSKAFGFNVKNGSLLKEALIHTISLTSPEARNVDITGALRDGTALRVNTESEAKELSNVSENNYERKTGINSDELGHTINITNKSIDRPKDNLGNVMSKLRDQMAKAQQNINAAKDKKEEIALKIRYSDMKEDYNRLASERNITIVAETGKKQMEWVDKVLAQKEPSAIDINAAIDAVNIWGNVTSLMYGGQESAMNIGDQFAEVQNAAQVKRIELINTKARKLIGDFLLGKGVNMATADFNKNLEDPWGGSALFLELARMKPLLVQSIASFGKDAKNKTGEEILRITGKLTAIEKLMKSEGITNNDMLQDGSWGLVQRLSGKWHAYIGEQKAKLNNAIAKADETEGLNETVRRTKKAEAWNRYWSEIRKSAVFVDTRKFFDFNDGSKFPEAKTKEHFDALAKGVGSEEYAKELIEKAHDKFNEYVQERETAREYIHSQIELKDEELGLSKEEQDKILSARKTEQFDKWLKYNSPTEFLNKMNSDASVKYVNDGGKWLVMVPKVESKGFYDPKYTKLMDGGKKQKVYEDYKAIIKELVSYLPLKEQAKLGEDFLPIMSPEIVQSLAGTIGKIRNFDTTVLNAFTATEGQEASKLRPDIIPLSYLRDTKRTAEDGGKSQDLIRIAEVFSMMALHYKNMSKVLPYIEVAERIIEEENRKRINGESNGEPLPNTLKMIKYFKDAMIFNKPVELEYKLDIPIHSLNPITHIKADAEIKGLLKEKADIEQQIYDLHTNQGEWQHEELDKRLTEIDEDLDRLQKNDVNIYGSKFGSTLMKLNQLVTIGFGPVASSVHFTFRAMNLSTYANGRVDFDSNDLSWARSKATSIMAKYFTFGNVVSDEALKIGAIVRRLGITGDVVDTDYGQSNIIDRRNKSWVNALSPFNWERSGDFYLKSTLTLAMMHKTKIDVVDAQTGETKNIPLYDAFNKEGKWDTTKWEENKKWSSDNIDEQVHWNQYRNRVRKVSNLVYGNNDKSSPLMARKNIGWRLVSQFRISWFGEGIAQRFLGERNDIELGRATKGRYITAMDLGIMNTAGILLKQALSSLPGVHIDPFEGRTDKKGEPISALDIENMRKNFAGLAWTIGFAASLILVQSIYEEEKNGRKATMSMKGHLLFNMLTRNYNDLIQYASPSKAIELTGNIVPAIRLITNTQEALMATSEYVIGGTAHKDAGKRAMLKIAKLIPGAAQYPKINTMLQKNYNDVVK